MAQMRFELVSPERLVASGEAERVTVPGSEGDFGVMALHAPMVSTLRPGVLVIEETLGSEKKVFVRGGFAEAGPEGLTVLAEQAVPVEELDADLLAQALKDAEEDLADAQDEETKRRAENQLAQLQDVISVLKTMGHG
ncbi:MAG: F0F1 ATP synthase subunit epsilon [Pseudomonadota bacterium]